MRASGELEGLGLVDYCRQDTLREIDEAAADGRPRRPTPSARRSEGTSWTSCTRRRTRRPRPSDAPYTAATLMLDVSNEYRCNSSSRTKPCPDG
jgi:hypothetical protein